MPRLGNGPWNWLGCLGLLTVGCAHTNQSATQPPPAAPPPGWGMTAAPAPSGCSSCGGTSPVVNAPRYAPPTAAPPPVIDQPHVLGSPITESARLQTLAQQSAFRPPLVAPAARLGTIITEESTLPVPPSDSPAPPIDQKTPESREKLPYITQR